jgi:hypothetical protein
MLRLTEPRSAVAEIDLGNTPENCTPKCFGIGQGSVFDLFRNIHRESIQSHSSGSIIAPPKKVSAKMPGNKCWIERSAGYNNLGGH